MHDQSTPPAGVHSRAIRVFISSTFRDMQAERDELVKRVFPQVRKLCERRGVAWAEVDLRWGVTDEQKAEGKILSVCLAEIQNCRPYFIGLLGERYGWVPAEFPPNLSVGEPWLGGRLGCSVTELEILHGALNDPAMTGHAFFYLRDPSYLNSLPRGMDRADFACEGPESAEKLARLKDRIRSSECTVRDGYRNPHELAELVLADLSNTVDRLFPPGSEPDPLDRELAEHEAFAAGRAQVYVARATNFHALDDHASGGSAPLVVLGESGSGKSALVANWALARQQSRSDEILVMHFVGASPESTDGTLMLRRIIGELKRRCELPGEIPDRPERLQAEFGNWLGAAGAKARVVLVIDALNQLEDRDEISDLSWLPRTTPANVRVIVSTLPGAALDEVVRRGWPSLYVEPLRPEEREALVVGYLGRYSKSLSAGRLRAVVEAEPTSNPLYLRALLEELRVFGVHERLDERLTYYLAALTPEELYARILARYESDYDEDRPGLVRDAMALLWAARRGLGESELLELLGRSGTPLPRAHWAPLAVAAESMLVNRSGLLRFSHDYIRDAVRQKYLPRPRDQRAAHRRLASHFQRPGGGRDRTAWLRVVACLAFVIVAATALVGLLRLLTAMAEGPTPLSTSERLLLIAPAVMALVLSAALGIWTVWALARVMRPVRDRVSGWASLLRRRPAVAGSGEPSPRCVDELPWQLARSGAWWRLYGLLRNLPFFRAAWQADPFQVVAYWREVESGTLSPLVRALARTRELEHAFRDVFGGRVLDAYRRVVTDPVAYRAPAAPVAQLLLESGYGHDSSALIDRVVQHDVRRDDRSALVDALVLQADGFRTRNYSVATMAAYKRAERLCATTGEPAQLSRCIEGQAHVLLERDDLDQALTLASAAEHAGRESGDATVLARALVTKANVFRRRQEPDAALAALDEAEHLLRSVGNRAEMIRVLDEKQLALSDLGKLEGASDAARRAALLRSELGAASAPELPGSRAELLDERLAALRGDEQEYRRTGRRDLLASALVEQAYHWAVLRRFPLAAKPLGSQLSELAKRRGLEDLLSEIRPTLKKTRLPVLALIPAGSVHVPGAIVRPIVAALALGALALLILSPSLGGALPVLREGGLNLMLDARSLGALTWIGLVAGSILLAAALRSAHALFDRPYLIMAPQGLAMRYWRPATESLTARLLAHLLVPFHGVESTAVAWSELRDCRVNRGFFGVYEDLVLETDSRMVTVGRIFRRSPKWIRREILERFREVARSATETSARSNLASDEPVLPSSRHAVASLVMGIASFLIIPFLGGLLAVILGHRARRAIRDGQGGLGGESQANWGLFLGYANLSILVAVVIATTLILVWR